MALLDAGGHELLWNDDDTIFGDPHLELTPQEGARRILRVGSLGGGPNAEYRLVAGAFPFVRHTLPAGLQRGASTEIALHGVNLDRVAAVWMGDREAVGEIVRQSPDELVVRLTAPASAAVGPHRLHLEAADGEAPITPRVWVSDLPEVAAGSPDSLERALRVEGPVVVNGALSRPKQRHYFSFQARAGEVYDFRVDSMKLEYHLDPTLTLLDSEGRKIAYADDPGIDERADEYQLDPTLSHRFEKDGVYYAVVRDGMYRGREDFCLPADDCAVRTLFPGGAPGFGSHCAGRPAGLGTVRVRRRAGWNTPVEVWAENLPPGVTSERRTAAPEDSVVKDTCGVERVVDGTIVNLPIQAPAGAVGRAAFVVKAAGEWNGARMERTATVIYERYAAGYLYGPMEVQQAELTVVPAPRVLLTVPETVVIAAGEPARIRVGVRRFLDLRDQELTIRLVGLPQGWTAAPVRSPASDREAVLELEAPSAPTSATVRVQAALGDEPAAESAPIEIQARGTEGAGPGDED